MIEINASTEAVIQALQAAQARSSNLEPAYKSIGEALVASTQQRFQDRQDPEGNAWASLSSVTRERKGHNRQLEGESKVFPVTTGLNRRLLGGLVVLTCVPRNHGAKPDQIAPRVSTPACSP